MLGSDLLLSFWDWHAIFWSLRIAGMVIFALGCTVASSREADAPRVDWLGAVDRVRPEVLAPASSSRAPETAHETRRFWRRCCAHGAASREFT